MPKIAFENALEHPKENLQKSKFMEVQQRDCSFYLKANLWPSIFALGCEQSHDLEVLLGVGRDN